MTEEKNAIRDIQDIKSLMEKSTRFISLSGLSGVIIGIIALGASWYAHLQITEGSLSGYLNSNYSTTGHKPEIDVIHRILLFAGGLLFISLLIGIIFTYRKARKNGVNITDKSALRFLSNVSLPLIAGGLVCMVLLFQSHTNLLCGLTLTFYGLALLNGSNFTLKQIKYLGILEICLGVIALYHQEWSLILWAIGFGLLHIIYGAAMYIKYDR